MCERACAWAGAVALCCASPPYPCHGVFPAAAPAVSARTKNAETGRIFIAIPFSRTVRPRLQLFFDERKPAQIPGGEPAAEFISTTAFISRIFYARRPAGGVASREMHVYRET